MPTAPNEEVLEELHLCKEKHNTQNQSKTTDHPHYQVGMLVRKDSKSTSEYIQFIKPNLYAVCTIN